LHSGALSAPLPNVGRAYAPSVTTGRDPMADTAAPVEAEVDEQLDRSSNDENARIDIDTVRRMLLGSWPEVRLASRRRTEHPDLHHIPGLSMADHRQRVFDQLKSLAEKGDAARGFPKAVGGQDDHGGNLAAYEELILADPSLAIKAGVQWGLFGAAILHLGTEEHHLKWLPGAISLETPGAFAMTEIGHGSDVASLATTATYDPEAEEFVIHTPFRAATKEYLG